MKRVLVYALGALMLGALGLALLEYLGPQAASDAERPTTFARPIEKHMKASPAFEENPRRLRRR